MCTRRSPAAGSTAAPSTIHGTLVSRATWSVTAPATPKVAASIALASTPLRLEELADHRREIVVVERDEFADLDPGGPLGRPREEPEQRLGPAYVGRQQHRCSLSSI